MICDGVLILHLEAVLVPQIELVGGVYGSSVCTQVCVRVCVCVHIWCPHVCNLHVSTSQILLNPTKPCKDPTMANPRKLV